MIERSSASLTKRLYITSDFCNIAMNGYEIIKMQSLHFAFLQCIYLFVIHQCR